MMAEKKAFKDWFDRTSARQLGEQIAAADPSFDVAGFVSRASRGLGKLEMMDRVKQFSQSLRTGLPDSIPKALKIIERSFPEPLPDCDRVTDGWLQWPVGQFIADFATEHPEPALITMHALTQRFSAEFAIRPFVEMYPEHVFSRLEEWVVDPSPHVRRLCSEGIRTRLPWGARLRSLVADPTPIFPILEALKDDPELYVRRSVANNLNDIIKDHPDAVFERCRRWWADADEKRQALVRQALRGAVKAGDPRALEILGFAPPREVSAVLSAEPSRVAIGESVSLVLQLDNASADGQPLIVDYAVHYVLDHGKTSRKVFKWTQKELPARGALELRKSHSMKPTTIRTLRPGHHRIDVQLNGRVVAESSFELSERTK